jgi:hypothetical protein
MRRYGDNASKDEPEEQQPPNKADVQVMYGGCGYGAGSFTRPPRRKKRFDLLVFLGLRKPKAKSVS